MNSNVDTQRARRAPWLFRLFGLERHRGATGPPITAGASEAPVKGDSAREDVDRWNLAAETHFQRIKDSPALLNKPFHTNAETPLILYKLGLLLANLAWA
ncbi:MAG: hypothetical protein HY727_05710 [Candidatus Rokubacteria bacterium]|nr:hypothetical protein [Candidatus Rokubacteria bacterium]